MENARGGESKNAITADHRDETDQRAIEQKLHRMEQHQRDAAEHESWQIENADRRGQRDQGADAAIDIEVADRIHEILEEKWRTKQKGEERQVMRIGSDDAAERH